MWRSFFLLGALTGFVCGLALILEPLPDLGSLARGSPASIPDATYRMDGVITRNTCPTRPAPWPHLWTVSGEQLRIGDETIRARVLRAATLYEAVKVSSDGCAMATWSIKLVPMGAGLRGSASWEVRSRTAAGHLCEAPPSLPCVLEADVVGLPDEALLTTLPPR